MGPGIFVAEVVQWSLRSFTNLMSQNSKDCKWAPLLPGLLGSPQACRKENGERDRENHLDEVLRPSRGS